jgi:uncharacterized protein YecE (DUF72 family)
MARFLVGTSGWSYYGWRRSFFPEDLPSRKWLSFYADRFSTVEVNYSFYHLPRATTYANWYAQTPADFVFALKASRLITHIKRLKNVGAEWKEFAGRAAALKQKLGPILLQFPPSFHATAENFRLLEHFFLRTADPKSTRLATEFRHESCFGEEMLRLLRRHRVALVISHSSRYPVPRVLATGGFAYFRFHGPRELFASSYSEAELRAWGTQMKKLLKRGFDVYVYFNNDVGGYAIANARTLNNGMR